MSQLNAGEANAPNFVAFSKRVTMAEQDPLWVNNKCMMLPDLRNQGLTSASSTVDILANRTYAMFCDRLDLSAQAFVVKKEGDNEHDRTRA